MATIGADSRRFEAEYVLHKIYGYLGLSATPPPPYTHTNDPNVTVYSQNRCLFNRGSCLDTLGGGEGGLIPSRCITVYACICTCSFFSRGYLNSAVRDVRIGVAEEEFDVGCHGAEAPNQCVIYGLP